MDLLSLPTPLIAIDRTRVNANIKTMQARAAEAGVGLRPHTKTHKSPVIARWQLEAGAIGICCAKLAEAEVFADAGFTNIRLPYPVNPANAERVEAAVDLPLAGGTGAPDAFKTQTFVLATGLLFHL